MEICSFEKREAVERFVTAVYERGAYNPEAPLEAVCMACGFTMDMESMGHGVLRGMGKVANVDLARQARFCPICGSRFNRTAEYGLYPEELDPREEGELTPLAVRSLSGEEYRELIGEELFEDLQRKGRQKDE